MLRLLITGGTGYLGSELVRQSSAQGWEVAASYFSQPPHDANAQWIALDIRDQSATLHCIADLSPAVIIHTAYRQSGPNLWSVSAEGAHNVAQAAQQLGARLIHLSSDALFDGERSGSYTEADSPNPISPYGEAKAVAERLVVQTCPNMLLVRTSLIYGGRTPSPHEQLVLNALDGRVDLAFFTDELRCPIVVADLAAALLELACLPVVGVLNVAGADIVSRYEFARLVARTYQRDANALRAALSANSAVRRPRNCALDSSTAQALLHTRLRGVYEVLAG